MSLFVWGDPDQERGPDIRAIIHTDLFDYAMFAIPDGDRRYRWVMRRRPVNIITGKPALTWGKALCGGRTRKELLPLADAYLDEVWADRAKVAKEHDEIIETLGRGTPGAKIDY